MKNLSKISYLALVVMLLIGVLDTSCAAQRVKKDKKKKKEKVEEVKEEAKETTNVQKNDKGCAMYGSDPQETNKTYSLFKTNYDNESYEDAMPYWREIFNTAPGLRQTTFFAGEKMFRAFIEAESEPNRKQTLIDSLFLIYDKRVQCWGGEAEMAAKKASDYRIFFPEKEKETFELHQKALDLGGNETPYYILYPYFKDIIKGYNDKAYDKDQVVAKYNELKLIADANISGEHKYAKQYQEGLEKMTELKTSVLELEDLLIDQALRDQIKTCPDARGYYEPRYRENPDDVTTVATIYKRMKEMKCYDDPFFIEVTEKLNQMEPTPSLFYFLGNRYSDQKDYSKAISSYESAINLEDEISKKATYTKAIAKVYHYRNVDYTKAREYYRKAAELDPTDGEPYLNIGLMYASSGKKCGPGTGIKSQRVIWPAMDMWQKAKKIDPSVADKAQEYINKYYSYLPEKKDIFMRGDMEVGGSYYVDCWIQESTTVRTK